MIALSFLGIGNYKETTYVLGDKRHRTRFFSAALPHIFPLEKLFVIQTEEARQKYGDALRRECDYEPIVVPSGKNEEELWQLFGIMADAVPSGATLLMDVTHGFRSQPMLGLAAAVYLQAAKNVTIDRIVYGAWESRNETDESPVFDLTPFQKLIEWASAARFFLRAGDAVALAHLLSDTQAQTHLSEADYRARGLNATGKTLQRLTRSLALVQPLHALDAAKRLPRVEDRLETDLDHLPEARPFAALLDEVRARFAQLVEAEGHLFTAAGFRAQAAMIRYYLTTDQLQQALTLSREALVSRLCVQITGSTERDVLLKKEHREKAQNFLHTLVERVTAHEFPEGSPSEKLASVWARLRDLRNHVNHAGMREEQLKLKKLYDNTRKLCDEVSALLTEGPEAFPTFGDSAANSPPAS